MIKELSVTGCIDCGTLKSYPKDYVNESFAGFTFGKLAVRMWKDPDNRHQLILVKADPERMFLSCQPFSKLLTEDGVAAILNFVQQIPKESNK